MEAKIKSMHLINFKCISDKEYVFDEKSMEFKGKNGVGKTTVATAFYWLLSDRDYDLHSNPMVRKIGSEELDPTVEIVFSIDGKEVTVSKTQKRTVKKSKTGGNETISFKNLYEVNGIGFGEKTFKEKLMEYGFDLNLFLTLSHPNIFVSKKSDEMRKILFSMVKSFSDLEIAEKTKGCDVAAELLKSYSIEEVKAMQNSKIKKSREIYGKNGEILDSIILGLEQAKVNIDVAELELAKKSVEDELNINLDKQVDLSKQLKGFTDLSNEILQIKFDQGDLKRKSHEELMEREKAFQTEISMARSKCNDVSEKIMALDLSIKRVEANLVNAKDEIETCRIEWKRAHDLKFDESTLICPMCGQELPEEKKNSLVKEFGEKKQKQLDSITIRGNQLRDNILSYEKNLESNRLLKSKLEDDEFKYDKELAEIKAKHVSLLTPINIEETDEWKVLQKQIDDKEKTLNSFSGIQDIQSNLKHEESELRLKLNQLTADIARVQNNVEIDEKISKLKAEHLKHEQIISDSEKILYQLDLIGRNKNEMLSCYINKNFDLVEFKLFDYQKNGEYKEVCIPTIKGKDLNVSTNTGLELQMKLDIVKGLQKFYGMYVPAFIDGAECLDTDSKKNIQMECQVVYLTVSDDDELKTLEV